MRCTGRRDDRSLSRRGFLGVAAAGIVHGLGTARADEPEGAAGRLFVYADPRSNGELGGLIEFDVANGLWHSTAIKGSSGILSARVAPDGRAVALPRVRGFDGDVDTGTWIVPVGDGEPRRVLDAPGGACWSADGRT